MATVEHRHTTTIEAPRSRVLAVLGDVATYDRWLDVVHRVDPDPTGAPDGSAWFFTLRARIGPFARSKRLRVVERPAPSDDAGATVDRVRLERCELDGRDHADWTFDASLSDAARPHDTDLTLTLAYGGRLWTAALNAVLDNQLRTATLRLQELALADR